MAAALVKRFYHRARCCRASLSLRVCSRFASFSCAAAELRERSFRPPNWASMRRRNVTRIQAVSAAFASGESIVVLRARAPLAVVQNRTYVEEHTALQRKIFANYNRSSRPVRNSSQTTVAMVHLHLMHFSIQQKQQSMRLFGHIYMASDRVFERRRRVAAHRRAPPLCRLGTTSAPSGIRQISIMCARRSSRSGNYGSQISRLQTAFRASTSISKSQSVRMPR